MGLSMLGPFRIGSIGAGPANFSVDKAIYSSTAYLQDKVAQVTSRPGNFPEYVSWVHGYSRFIGETG